MDFRSDNTAPAHPAIFEALAKANQGTVGSYGNDPLTKRVTERLCELFEREVAVYPVATGTAANSLALALFTPPWGAVYCHSRAHINTDEGGAPEFFMGGAKLIALHSDDGKLDPASLEGAIQGAGNVHAVQPAAISIAQASEAGTLYSPDDVRALSAVAKRHKLALHMDGARFANALVALGATPAEITWKAGVDVLSFGATKNGCLAAEAVVVFDPAKAESLPFRRKRSGHLFSKMRLISAQLDAYLTEGLWLQNARHANRAAQLLAKGLEQAGIESLFSAEANMIFAELSSEMAAQLEKNGAHFYHETAWGPHSYRFVTSFQTSDEEIERFLALVKRLGNLAR